MQLLRHSLSTMRPAPIMLMHVSNFSIAVSVLESYYMLFQYLDIFKLIQSSRNMDKKTVSNTRKHIPYAQRCITRLKCRYCVIIFVTWPNYSPDGSMTLQRVQSEWWLITKCNCVPLLYCIVQFPFSVNQFKRAAIWFVDRYDLTADSQYLMPFAINILLTVLMHNFSLLGVRYCAEILCIGSFFVNIHNQVNDCVVLVTNSVSAHFSI